jgi:hypothetical protein
MGYFDVHGFPMRTDYATVSESCERTQTPRIDDDVIFLNTMLERFPELCLFLAF